MKVRERARRVTRSEKRPAEKVTGTAGTAAALAYISQGDYKQAAVVLVISLLPALMTWLSNKLETA